MQLRIFTEPQQGASYGTLLSVAQATEQLGFEAFFRSDHYLTMSGSGLPGPTDAWATLAGLARETSRIRLGTLMSPVTFRLPGPLAITVAQVDQMSGGRVELGLGTGWFDAEHTAYGIPFPPLAERFGALAEQLEVITGLWETAEGSTVSAARSSGRSASSRSCSALAMPCRRHDARTSRSASAKVRPGRSVVTSAGSGAVRSRHQDVEGRSGIPDA